MEAGITNASPSPIGEGTKRRARVRAIRGSRARRSAYLCATPSTIKALMSTAIRLSPAIRPEATGTT